MAYPSDHTFTNSLTCPSNAGYYQNIPADVDYITIMLGINDCQHTGSGTTGDGEDATGVITLGTINDTGTDTYYGAYNTVLSWIRNNRPYAHVGIIVTNGTERQNYTEAQIALARKWGYPLINLNGDDHTPAMIRCYNTNMSAELKTLIKQKQAVDYDGSQTGSVNTHPNYEAHEYESTFIEAWLRTL
jgi:lysophospholipase L1-like esterase